MAERRVMAGRHARRVGPFVVALPVALGLGACGPRAPATPPAPPPTELHFTHACDLAPAAGGLAWLVEAKPRAIADVPDLIPAIATVVPEARFSAFAGAHGGIDLRRIDDLCLVRYRDTTLTIAKTAIDPARVTKAYAERTTTDLLRTNLVANPPVIRLAPTAPGATSGTREREQLVLIGSSGILLEEDAASSVRSEARPATESGAPMKATPSRAAEAFLVGKLKRAAPALRGAALASTAALLEDAPLRAFLPGPFDAETGKALGGLLRAATAVGLSVRYEGAPTKLRVRLVLTGAWGDDGAAAAERLAAAVHVLSESPAGRLFGIDHPLEGPTTRALADALVLDAVIDATPLARGVHDALDADVNEIMEHTPRPRR